MTIYALTISNADDGMEIAANGSVIVSTSIEKLKEYLKDSFETSKETINDDPDLQIHTESIDDDLISAELGWNSCDGFTFSTVWYITETCNLDNEY